MVRLLLDPAYAARRLGKWRGSVLLLYTVILFIFSIALFVSAPSNSTSAVHICLIAGALALAIFFCIRGIYLIYRDVRFMDHARRKPRSPRARR